MRWYLVVALLLSSVASADEWHLFRAKTVFAFAVAQEEADKTVVPADGKCKDCYGTGKRGDGRITFKCPTCNGTGKVQSGDAGPIVGDATEESPSTEFVEQIGVVKLLAVVGPPRTCKPCEDWKKKELPVLRKAGWKEGNGESDHLQVIVYEDFVELYGIEVSSIPCFYVSIDGKVEEDSLISGYTAADKLANHVNSYRVGSRQKTAKSIVRVVMMGKRPKGNVIEYFQGFGTGVVIDSREDGFTVLTAEHCVADADKIEVEIFGRDGLRKHPARILSADKEADAALLDVLTDDPLPSVEVLEDELPEGTRLFAWGCDDGGEPVFRETIVGNFYEVGSIPYLRTVGDYEKGFEADPVKGRSGGGLFWKGKLVAIYTHANIENKTGICVRVGVIRRLKGLR